MPNSDLSNGTPAGGSSYLYANGTSPNTRAVVSQKVKIRTPHYGNGPGLQQMGVLSTFSPNESRNVDFIAGIGFGDQIAELVPGPTQPTTASFERALLYLCNLWQATGYAAGISGAVRSLRHHRWPFDVELSIVFSTMADMDLDAANKGFNGKGTFQGGAVNVDYLGVTNDLTGKPGDKRGHTALVTMYEACWFTSWNTSFSKDTGIVMESGECMVSDVHDFSSTYGEFLATGNDPSLGLATQPGSSRFGKGKPA